MSEEGINEGYQESLGQRTHLEDKYFERWHCVRSNDFTTMEINQWGIF